MSKLEKAKEIIKQNYIKGDYGIFNTRNISGDTMATIYDDGELQIDICYEWSYFEVFGLSKEEFNELYIFYESLGD